MPIPYLELVRRFWKLAALGALLLGCAILHQLWQRAGKALEAERAAHALTMARYTAAQDVAARVANENKLRKENADEKARQNADADLAALRDRYRAAVDKLRRQAPPAARASGNADLPGPGETAQGANGSGDGSGIPVSADDALICADNTARLQVARDWAIRVGRP